MNKLSIISNIKRKNTVTSSKYSELKFWRDIALRQQAILHEKNRT